MAAHPFATPIASFTIAITARLTALGNWEAIFGSSDSVYRGPSVFASPTGQLHVDHHNAGTNVRYAYVSPGPFFAAGEYAHVVWVKSGPTSTLYRDCAYFDTAPSPNTALDPVANYEFGRVYSSTFRGAIDDATIWTRPLSASEVWELCPWTHSPSATPTATRTASASTSSTASPTATPTPSASDTPTQTGSATRTACPAGRTGDLCEEVVGGRGLRLAQAYAAVQQDQA